MKSVVGNDESEDMCGCVESEEVRGPSSPGDWRGWILNDLNTRWDGNTKKGVC